MSREGRNQLVVESVTLGIGISGSGELSVLPEIERPGTCPL